jgi:hypothetical protein
MLTVISRGKGGVQRRVEMVEVRLNKKQGGNRREENNYSRSFQDSFPLALVPRSLTFIQ